MLEYVVQGRYCSQGWDDLTYEDSMQAAREQKRCYDENEPQVPHRIIRRRA